MTVVDSTERRGAGHDGVVVATPDFARRRLRARLSRWRPYLLTLLAAVVVAIGVWLLYFSSAVTVTSVEVTGNDALTTARIEKVAAVPAGEQLIRVDLAAIQARIERIDAVQAAQVSRSWPHTISVQVTERVPIAVLRRGGAVLGLDAEGVVFTVKESQLPKGLPVVQTALNVNAATLGEAARVVVALRSDIAARVERIKADSIDRIVLELDGGVTVEWGSAEDSENKARVLAILLARDVTEIDVSVPGRPTTR
ncbi:MAG: FtsQ-type POTRA domain-containing protein [Propionibacteriales bacterium]|nr:FtsQ-type POTRA domain-containing protein [Propionibacteriales bacterium]